MGHKDEAENMRSAYGADADARVRQELKLTGPVKTARDLVVHVPTRSAGNCATVGTASTPARKNALIDSGIIRDLVERVMRFSTYKFSLSKFLRGVRPYFVREGAT